MEVKDRGDSFTKAQSSAGFRKIDNRLHEASAGTLLRDAAFSGDLEQVKVVADACPSLRWDGPRWCGPLGETPLHVAAAAGHVGIVEFLLEKKAHPDSQDRMGETALHYTAIAGETATAEVLLATKADPTIESFHSETALEVAQLDLAYFLGVETAPVRVLLSELEL